MVLRVPAGWRPLVVPVGSALLAALLLAGVGTVALVENHETVERDGLTRVSSNADAAVRAVVSESEDYLRSVEVNAQDDEFVAALSTPGAVTRSDTVRSLATAAVGADAAAAFLSDARGRYVAGSPFQSELLGVSFAYRDWFRGVSAEGRPYVSSGYRSAAPGHPLVVGVAAPVSADGRRVGYVTLLWQLESIRAVAAGSLRDDGISISVADQVGQSLSSDLAVDARGQPVTETVTPVVERALAGEYVQGVVDDDFVATAPVPGLGWTVTSSQPASAALADTRPFTKSLLSTLGTALLMLIGAGIYGGRLAIRRDQQRKLLAEKTDHLTALFDASPVGIIEGLPDGTILRVNREVERMVRYSSAELLDMSARELSDPVSDAATAKALRDVVEGSVTSYTGERVYRTRSGEPVPVLLSVSVLRDATGSVKRMVAYVMDLTQTRAKEAAARISESRFRKIFDEGLIGKALTADTGVIVRANPTLAGYLGVTVEELSGRPLACCFKADEDQREVADLVAARSGEMNAEAALRGSTEAEVWSRVAIRWVEEANNEWILLAQFEDITARRVAERKLREMALHDELTGLPNRRLLMERCDHAFAAARSARTGTSVTALFIDLDGFKAVNDRLGHAAGDGVLTSIANDVALTLREDETLARVGGDEFVVLLTTGASLEAARLVADRVAHLIRRDVRCSGGTALPVSASIGIARVDLAVEPDVVPEELLRRADGAMYRAKDRGRNRHEVFDE